MTNDRIYTIDGRTCPLCHGKASDCSTIRLQLGELALTCKVSDETVTLTTDEPLGALDFFELCLKAVQIALMYRRGAEGGET